MIIECISGTMAGKVCKIDRGIIIGRNSKACSIIYPDDAGGVSRSHCKIEKKGSKVVISDMGSSYGTFVNGEKLTPFMERELYSGDSFYLGNPENTYLVKNEDKESMRPRRKKEKREKEPRSGVSAGKVIAIILGILFAILLVIIIYIAIQFASLANSTGNTVNKVSDFIGNFL